MSAPVICFACAALRLRGGALDVNDRYRLALNCVCGGVSGADYRALRAGMYAQQGPVSK